MSISLSLSVVTSLAGETPIVLSPGTQTITKSGKGFYSDYKTINSSGDETLTGTTLKGELTTAGLLFIRNCDSTNFVSIGSSADKIIKILAGESFCWRLSGGDLVLRADTAPVTVQYVLLEA